MHRFKDFILPSIVLTILLGLTISFSEPASISGTDHSMASIQPKKMTIDPKEEALYHWQQQELEAAVKSYFKKAIASGDIVGAGVSIVRGDSIVISQGFGKRNSKMDKEVDGQTIFRLGSLSKGFAGILAAKIIQEGALHREDKVSTYIPDFQLGDSKNTDKVTLAHILSHTSGAPYHSFTNLVEAGLPLSTIAERFKEVHPISAPGTLYSYQNALFALSGEMIYRATGQDIATSLDNKFFKPLEMCSTTMDYKSLGHAINVAMPHYKSRYGWRPKKLNDHYYNAIAAGGISASAEDMGKWMRFILGHNPEVMSTSAISEAFKPVIEIKGRSKYYQRWDGHVSSAYGFGWRIHKFVEDSSAQEKTIWHHGGSVNNYRNEIAIYPEADLGICVLLNSNSRLATKVIPDLYKIVQEVYAQNTTHVASTNFSPGNPDY
ncbi:serine hydrolase domain-containing protein [Muriicola sp.]|uniref:serine hydrolase domain-containing protein n=1 Tax=Muriicola sp. TaxID=2020856 RepID=UPI003C789747